MIYYNSQYFQVEELYCESCVKTGHIIKHCPLVHQKKSLYRTRFSGRFAQKNDRDSEWKRNSKRKKIRTLSETVTIQEITNEFREENDELIRVYDEIVDDDGDSFIYNKRK